jgi:hypothetical protein
MVRLGAADEWRREQERMRAEKLRRQRERNRRYGTSGGTGIRWYEGGYGDAQLRQTALNAGYKQRRPGRSPGPQPW